MRKKLGYVVGGGLVDGLLMRLDSGATVEDIKAGKFVCIQGGTYRFFSLITDVQLNVMHDTVMHVPFMHQHDSLTAQTLKRRNFFATLAIKPLIMIDKEGNRLPVKTIPVHCAPVFDAHEDDIALIFGSESEHKKYFAVGSPLDMHMPVCIDLEKFTERSNAIFGKTGTGKTFITRVILAGIVQRQAGVNLIFDMHSEYGLQARQEGSAKTFVKGLKTLFPSRVAIFSLDPASTRRRGSAPDCEVVIGYDELTVDDVMLLADELSLHPTAFEAAYLLYGRYKKQWLKVLLESEQSIKDLASDLGAHVESLGALLRKLKRLERFDFLVPQSSGRSVVTRMLEYLDKGISVILEFGHQTSMLSYLLVSGLITRRIHEHYVEKTEVFLADPVNNIEPQKLVITIEEAHKFLNPQAARQTIFGIIAREMRKYYVSLLVVDQRPSGIDPEVLSQVGTKLVAQLNDDRDIQAVLTGVSNAQGLRAILATLDSKKQALVMGHAIAMPVVIKTREYNNDFYTAMMHNPLSTTTAQLDDVDALIDDIF